VKSLSAAVFVLLCCSVNAQQAPVTRSEFASFFLPIAASFDIPEAQRKNLISFPLDDRAIGKPELAMVLIATAKSLGKDVGGNSDPLVRLKNSKLLPDNAAIFVDPGNHFRPTDVVKALIAFVDGMTGKPEVKSTEEPKLTFPRTGNGGDRI
jgi:hypothetical protein